MNYDMFEITIDMMNEKQKELENVPRYSPLIFGMYKDTTGKYITLEKHNVIAKQMLDTHICTELALIEESKKLKLKLDKMKWEYENELVEKTNRLRDEFDYDYQRRNTSATIAAFCGGILFGGIILTIITSWLGFIN